MVHSIKQFYGDTLGALDGEIGHVKDFYFDDRSWALRYLVADTGSWLTGRQVLIAPHAFVRSDPSQRVLTVSLTRHQIENSPSIDTHKPVSRQYEEEYYKYYGWPSYWQGDALWETSGSPIIEPPTSPRINQDTTSDPQQREPSETHLISAHAVIGYHIQASDGPIGHICDFLIDEQNWSIVEVVIKIGHRFSGIEVKLPTRSVVRISYEDSTVFLNVTKETVEQSPAFQPAPEIAAP